MGETRVGKKRNVVVYCSTTDAIAIGQFALGVVLRNVYDEVELVLGNHLHHVRNACAFLVGPAHGDSRCVVLVEELGSTLRSVNGVASLYQRLCGVQQRSLFFCAT